MDTFLALLTDPDPAFILGRRLALPVILLGWWGWSRWRKRQGGPPR